MYYVCPCGFHILRYYVIGYGSQNNTKPKFRPNPGLKLDGPGAARCSAIITTPTARADLWPLDTSLYPLLRWQDPSVQTRAKEVERFLSHLATRARCRPPPAAGPERPVLLYRDVLHQPLESTIAPVRSKTPTRRPPSSPRRKSSGCSAAMTGRHALMARLLYGSACACWSASACESRTWTSASTSSLSGRQGR